jgi:hypothetical protein
MGGPSSLARSGGIVPSTGCMVSQPFLSMEEIVVSRLFNHNRRPMVSGVLYLDSSPRALHQAGGRSRSLDGGQIRFSYGTVGTSVAFGSEIVGLNPSRSRPGIP